MKSDLKYTQFTVFTSLYNETNRERINEYITCFEKNLRHKDIKKIIIFYDNSKDHLGKLEILNYIKSKGIFIIYGSDRPSYKRCFDAANKYCPNDRIILCNADIYFNDTLSILRSYDLENKFLSISRWNLKNGNIKLIHNRQGLPNYLSHDVWIFQTPIRDIVADDILLGTFWCDAKLAKRVYDSGLEIINPCYSIQCIHLHSSEIRHDGATYDSVLTHPTKDDILEVKWTKL